MNKFEFVSAICGSDIETLKILLKKKPKLVHVKHFDSAKSCLHICFQKKHDDGRECECLELLVNHGADINERCDRRHDMYHSWTPIMFAVHVKCVRCLKFLIAKGADLSIKTSLGNTVLILAVKERDFTIVETLIQHSSPALINHKDGEGKTALMWVTKCNVENAPFVCQQLIGAGADVNIRDKDGNTALICVAQLCRGRCADVLIRNSTLELINHRDNGGKTALMWAAWCPKKVSPSLVGKLIEAGADVNISDKDGQTAMMWVAECHRQDAPSVYKQFVEAGADVNITDKNGHTAFIHAVKKNNIALTEYLINISTPELINHRDNFGRTALMWATGSHRQEAPSLIQKLIEVGADVNITDANRNTALILAVKHAVTKKEVGNFDVLIQHFTPKLINHKNKFGKTALMILAAKYQEQDAPSHIKKLIEAGADVNITDTEGQTALILAVIYASISLETQNVDILIQNSTPELINHTDNGGRTALMWAILDNHNRCYDSYTDTAEHQLLSLRVSLCEHLIEVGADVNLRDVYGETALSFALEQKNETVVSLLLEKGAVVNTLLVNGKTLLHHVFEMQNWSLLNQLFIKGADPTLSFKHEEFIHQSIKHNEAAVLRTLVLNGFPPQDCTFSDVNLHQIYSLHKSASPLFLALWMNEPAMARYLITNKFFTRSDIKQTLAQFTELRQRLTRYRHNECLQILEFHLQTVQTLSTLCLVTITSALTQDFREDNDVRGTSSADWRFTPTFKERVESLGLPLILQRTLLHQTPSSRICCGQWKNITLEEERQFLDCNECDFCTGPSYFDEYPLSESNSSDSFETDSTDYPESDDGWY